MLATLLFSIGGLIVFIIVVVVGPILKSILRKKENSTSSPSSPKNHAKRNRARAQRKNRDQVNNQGQSQDPVFARQAFSPSAPPVEEQKPIIAIDDDIQESEYSLKNLDDAKRAVVYSEILKPKF